MRIKVKPTLDSQVLMRLGYQLVVKKGGYVSKDGATIVHLFRPPYNGEVSQFRAGVEDQHVKNVQQLREVGYLEEEGFR